MSVNFFNSKKILRLTPLSNDTEEVADNILAGNVRVFPKLSNVKVSSLDELWELKFESAPSTYALYVYALYPVSYLLNAYESVGDEGYLEKAVSLSLSFLDWERKNNKKVDRKREKILFGDHAVSNRTQTLCYLSCCLNNANRKLPEETLAALLNNGEYLAEPGNYSHYNHGLMMDLALLGLLNTLEGLKVEYPVYFKENLVARLHHSITRDLTEDGVHVENSSGYHFWMLGFLGKITPPLESLDKELYAQATDALNKASIYAQYITRPDGSVPTIGDTHANVKHKPSKGLGSKFFRHSNQVVFRGQDDSVWAHFSCGYKTHVHKHHDNGAFNVYHKGQDVFIDPGFLSYEATEDSLRIKSSSFHNIPRPLSQEQILKRIDIKENLSGYKDNLSSSSMLNFASGKGFELAVAKISDFSDQSRSIFRLVYWMKPNMFLVYDKAIGSVFPIECFWHVAPHLTVRSNSGYANSIFDRAGTLICKLSHFGSGFSDDTLSMEVNDGFYAKAFNESALSRIVQAESKSGEMCTIIDLCGEDAEGPKSASFMEGCVAIGESGANVKLNLAKLLVDSLGEGWV